MRIVRKLFILSLISFALIFTHGCATESPAVKLQQRQASLMAQLQQRGVQVIYVGNTVSLIIPSDTLFDPLTYDINEYNQYTLQMVAELIYNYGNMPVFITAYTDNIGSRWNQIKRSKEQGRSVASYLWSHGIADENIHIKAAAWTKAIASNKTIDGAGYNRRVEIEFQYY